MQIKYSKTFAYIICILLLCHQQNDIKMKITIKPRILTYACIKELMEQAKFNEAMYADLGMWDLALRYSNIWCRLLQALSNPDIFFQNS